MRRAVGVGAIAAAISTGACSSPLTLVMEPSPGGLHDARVVDRGEEGVRVIVDGVAGPLVTRVGDQGLVWNPSGTRLAYAARTDDRWAVVVDGKIGPTLDAIGRILWGKRLVYVASRASRWFVVDDGAEGRAWDRIDEGSLTFSPDGARLAYVAQGLASPTEDAPPSAVRVVVDGALDAPASAVGALSFTRDGRHYAYLRRASGRTAFALDGIYGAPYDAISSYTIDASGHTIALVVKEEHRWMAIVGSSVGPSYDDVSRVLLSDDGKHSLYSAINGPLHFVVHDGHRGPTYEALRPGSLRLSIDGTRWWYVVHRAQMWAVLENDEAVGWYREVGDPLVAGPHAMFTARDDLGEHVVRDGLAGRAFRAVGEPIATPDGEHWAYLADGDDGRILVRDDVEFSVAGAVEGTLAFSRDGARLGCFVAPSDADDPLGVWIDGVSRPLDGEALTWVRRRALGEDGARRSPSTIDRAWLLAQLRVVLER